ncbi:unnamed protein product [Coregonus sp. 'balchen']|nr:unnamed protein product [Coregonus sp. 'balchen']
MIWNNETEEVSFLLMKLKINDAGLYSSPPAVSVSDVKESSGGLPMLLCSSQGFYPETIEQVWFRDGQLLNTTLSDTQQEVNPDGSFTLHSYLPLSSGPSQTGLYLCLVNHSALSQPITVNHTVMSNGES